MKEETNQQLEQLLQDGIEFLRQAGEFASEQAPLVVQEYLLYYRVLYGTGAVIGILMMIAFFTLAATSAKKGSGLHADPEVVCGLGLGLGVLSGVCVAFLLPEILFVWLAPRAFLLEKFMGMIR